MTSAQNSMFYTPSTGKQTGTPSAFQPFSTISEDLVWDPYTGSSSYDLPSTRDSYRLPRPTNFRSEISRFTESLYNLAKPTPIKPRGQFPRVEKYPQSGNLSSILNPGLPMKPVQNLDRINPYTGLPNIEFIPTTEYLGLGTSSTYLPDATPSPDTTARRVAAILEPTETYSDLVANFQTRKADQHNLQLLEAQMSSMSLHQPPASLSLYPHYIHNNLTSTLTQNTPYNYVQTQPSYSGVSTAPVMNSANMDPTFLGRAPPPPPLAPPGPHQMYLVNTPVTPALNMNSNLLNSMNHNQMNQMNSHHVFPGNNQISGQVPPTAAPAFDQRQLDQAWLSLSNDLRRRENISRAGFAGTQPGHRLSSHYGHTEPPLQGTLDMMSIARVTDMTRPAYTGDSGDRQTATPAPGPRPQTRSHKLEHVYDELLSLPRMPRSPSELEPIPSSEDELTRYNERRRENLLTLMNSRRDAGNADLRKHQLSTKYQETKYIEKRIMGHVPSVLADLNQMDLNKKINDKNREMDRTLRQISRSYEDRCKQRRKMQSTLSLVKEIPKMEFDANNKLVAKETSTKLANVKRSKEENKIKMDDIEFEANEDIMSMIYWNALKEKMENRAPRQRQKERRRSKVKSVEKYCGSSSDADIGVVNKSPILKPNAREHLVEDGQNKVKQQFQRSSSVEKYCESSSDAEISNIMKSHLFKQKVEDHIPEKNRDAKIKHLKRYSPRLPNKLLPLEEIQSTECEPKVCDVLGSNVKTKKDLVINLESNTITPSIPKINPISNSSKLIRELKFLSMDDPVPSPAPGEGKRAIVESSDRQENPEIEYPVLKTFPSKSKKLDKNIQHKIQVDMPEQERLEIKHKELMNNSKKPLVETSRFDHFRKTRSSTLFESIPEVVVEKRMEKRTNSDPMSVVEEENTENGMEKNNLNISKTAKKHLGMAVTPIDRNDDDLKNFVHALQISSDDTITKSIVSQDYRKDESLSLMSTPQLTDAGFRDFAQALQISSDCTT